MWGWNWQRWKWICRWLSWMGTTLGHTWDIVLGRRFWFHSDLFVSLSQDFAENDRTPIPSGSGHGTAAAGIIAARSNNTLGVAGLCWECKIMCLRFIKGNKGKVTDQIAALDYAITKKVKISNNSYGGYGWGSNLIFWIVSAVNIQSCDCRI